MNPQKRCCVCKKLYSSLDPHPNCVRCTPRDCSRSNTCSLCGELSPEKWEAWEEQKARTRPYSSRKRAPRSTSSGMESGADDYHNISISSAHDSILLETHVVDSPPGINPCHSMLGWVIWRAILMLSNLASIY